MNRRRFLVASAAATGVSAAGPLPPQFGGQGKPSLGVVYDTDFGDTIDGPLGLALLYGLQAKNEARVVSVTTTKPSVASATFADILVRFYTGEPGGFFAPQPIGMATSGGKAEDTAMLTAVLAKPYGRGVKKLNDTADPVATIRNALSAQFEQNAVVVLAGPATNLTGLLDLPGAKDLIARKVKLLAVASFDASAKRLFAEWPTPIAVVPRETGLALPFPAAAMDKELAWAPAHPIVDAWRAAGGKDAPSWALAAGLYAVRPLENYFKLSEPGTVAIGADGAAKFTASADGKHRNLIVDPAQKEKVLQVFVELASTKAVPRRGRRGG
jgi:hypothetical protein